jgi:hypothetical protein
MKILSLARTSLLIGFSAHDFIASLWVFLNFYCIMLYRYKCVLVMTCTRLRRGSFRKPFIEMLCHEFVVIEIDV